MTHTDLGTLSKNIIYGLRSETGHESFVYGDSHAYISATTERIYSPTIGISK